MNKLKRFIIGATAGVVLLANTVSPALANSLIADPPAEAAPTTAVDGVPCSALNADGFGVVTGTSDDCAIGPGPLPL